jgi:hypothetical protein
MKSNVQTNTATKFAELLTQGINAWLEAGRLVAECLAADSGWADQVVTQYPEIGLETIYAFERIGQLKLHPRLLLADAPGFRALRRLPYHLQEKHLNDPFVVLIRSEKGWEELLISAANLTDHQVRQLINGSEIRSVAAQRAWLETLNTIKALPLTPTEMPYRILGKNLVVSAACRIKVSELARIIAQMET